VGHLVKDNRRVQTDDPSEILFHLRRIVFEQVLEFDTNATVERTLCGWAVIGRTHFWETILGCKPKNEDQMEEEQ
jgi:hypothetical protein